MNMSTPTIGRARALQANSTPSGIFTILAIDHRDSLRAFVAPDKPDTVPAAQLTEIKLAVIRQLARQASAVLTDPLYGAAQAIAAHALPGSVGLLTPLEEQGYLGTEFTRQTTSIAGWSVEKAKRMGGTGLKIFLFYHPDAGRASEKQREYVMAVLTECRRYELPLFLEPISYSLDTAAPKGSAEFAKQRRHIVVESARQLGALGTDVLKVEFPVDVKHERDQRVWADACAELNDAAPVPWALLSADEPFDTFKEQLRVACQAGASGFLAGRAVWREAAMLLGEEREAFLISVARNRFAELVNIAQESAKPWYSRYNLPMVDEHWYLEY